MDTRLLTAAAFIAGLSAGWLGKTWLEPVQSTFAVVTDSVNQNTVTNDNIVSLNLSGTSNHASTNSNDVNFATQNASDNAPRAERLRSTDNSTGGSNSGDSITSRFSRLLSDRLYFDAMILFQEQSLRNDSYSPQLKKILLQELNQLLAARDNSAFSELVEGYLSIYYEDIDILLLLADFNKSNGSYLEVIDVYLLAKTYAYTDVDQRQVDAHFENFVEEIDSLYTRQQNWWSLINFFSHINTSGLMTPTLQYRQAIAHLRSGDEGFAIEQLNQLLNDSLVGESAAIALNSIVNNTDVSSPEAPVVTAGPVWEGAESIALEKVGNQYVVNLTDNRQGSAKLLIDTGASMTVVSSVSFASLNASGDAIEQERRVFRTAGGVVMGTVYAIPEIRLGPYVMENTQVAVIDFDTGRDIDGLLGMNILGQFRFQIDQENARLLLSRQ